MAAEKIINTPAELIPNLVLEVGKLATWLQALGIVLLFWFIFQIVSLIINFKRHKLLREIHEDIQRLEGKINKLSKIKYKK